MYKRNAVAAKASCNNVNSRILLRVVGDSADRGGRGWRHIRMVSKNRTMLPRTNKVSSASQTSIRVLPSRCVASAPISGIGRRWCPARSPHPQLLVGGTADGHESLAERLRVVHARERRARHGDAEVAAQRLPALLDVPDQQPVGRDVVLDLLVPALERGDRVLLLLKAAVEDALPADGVDHMGRAIDNRAVGSREAAATGGVDGVRNALVPLLRVAHVEQHLRVGIDLHELLVEDALGPVHRGLKIREERLPVDGPALGRGLPDVYVLGSLELRDEVVAGAKPQLL